MENKSHAIAAGSFVLLLLTLLVALAAWLGRDTSLEREFELSSAEAVSGLQAQATVRFKGVPVGKVTAIGLDPLIPGNVLVRIAIDKQAPITHSTFASLGYQGVTGLAFVQLDDSGESKVPLAPGDAAPARIPIRPSLLSKLSDNGATIMAQLEETSRRANLLLSAENQKQLLTAINHLGQAALSVQQLSSHAEKALTPLAQEIQSTSARVGASADEARASARAFKAVTERMNATDGTLDQLAKGVDTLAATGQSLNNNTLPQLNRAVDDAARSARQVGRAAVSVFENPRSLIFGSGALPPGPGEPGFNLSPRNP